MPPKKKAKLDESCQEPGCTESRLKSFRYCDTHNKCLFEGGCPNYRTKGHDLCNQHRICCNAGCGNNIYICGKTVYAKCKSCYSKKKVLGNKINIEAHKQERQRRINNNIPFTCTACNVEKPTSESQGDRWQCKACGQKDAKAYGAQKDPNKTPGWPCTDCGKPFSPNDFAWRTEGSWRKQCKECRKK